MIFATVGSMFPFDRLIEQMDIWASMADESDVFAQIGEGLYIPQNMDYTRRLAHSEFTEICADAELIVAHAGMGSVITAGCVGRPVVLLPRIFEWGEHTSRHQVATANWLRNKPGVFVADSNDQLGAAIENARIAGGGGKRRLSPVAEPEFTSKIRAAILSR